MMASLNWTSIILGLFTLLSSCGWFINWRKYRQEVEGQMADNHLKEMSLSKQYVDEFSKNIGGPLKKEVNELRNEVTRLRHAIQKINSCPHRDDCPVLHSLQHESHDDDEPKDSGHDRHGA